MAFRDWNGDGKKDWIDDTIEYKIYKMYKENQELKKQQKDNFDDFPTYDETETGDGKLHIFKFILEIAYFIFILMSFYYSPKWQNFLNYMIAFSGFAIFNNLQDKNKKRAAMLAGIGVVLSVFIFKRYYDAFRIFVLWKIGIYV